MSYTVDANYSDIKDLYLLNFLVVLQSTLMRRFGPWTTTLDLNNSKNIIAKQVGLIATENYSKSNVVLFSVWLKKVYGPKCLILIFDWNSYYDRESSVRFSINLELPLAI